MADDTRDDVVVDDVNMIVAASSAVEVRGEKQLLFIIVRLEVIEE